MRNDLGIKGIEKKLLDETFQEIIQDNADVEEQMIEDYCRKKIKDDIDEKQNNKILMALMRKGFKYEQIRSVMRRVLDETNT